MAAPEAPLFYQGVPRTSAAFRLLKKMGWEEGEGLGKEKQGITEHVRVSKKKDNAGVGIDARDKACSNWTFNTTAFDNILKNLKVITVDEGKGDGKQEESVVDDLKENKSNSKKVTRPQGRYKKRELGKVMQGKSQADLDAILGYGSKSTLTNILKSRVGGSLSNDELALDSVFAVPSDRAKDNNAISTIECPSASKYVDMPYKTSVDRVIVDWWGAKHGFVRGGVLGGTSRNVKVRKEMEGEKGEIFELGMGCREAFCEQDQENLYNIVQDKATKGRQGLGIASRSKKIGGAYWKGQKLLLDSSDNDDTLKEGAMCVQDGKELDAMCNINEQKRKALLACDLDVGCTKKLRKTKEITPNWKQLCGQLLKKAPDQSMSIKHLYKLFVEVCDLPPSNDTDTSERVTLSFKEKSSDRKSIQTFVLGAYIDTKFYTHYWC